MNRDNTRDTCLVNDVSRPIYGTDIHRRRILAMLAAGVGTAVFAACGGSKATDTSSVATTTAPPAALAVSGGSTARRGTAPRTLTGTIAGADYLIQVPDHWNSTLLLYSHGMVGPGQPNPAMAVSDPITGAALLDRGYALVGSSYRTTGWAAEDGFRDQIALLDFFDRQVGTPDRTIAWGDSLGGMISAGFMQRTPERFAGALPMCGVLTGSVAFWNAALDVQVALKMLLAPNDPSLPLVRITPQDAGIAAQRAQGVFQAAQQSPAGRARAALVRALYPIADSPNVPPPTDTGGQGNMQAQVVSAFPYAVLGAGFGLRPDIEARAGGNPSFNTGVSYRDLLQSSAQRERVASFYEQAGLTLDADLQRLDDAPRIAAEPKALDYMRRNIVFDGAITRPVLTLHTVGDVVVPVAVERAYADVVQAVGNASLLRQTYVDRVGHTIYTPAERLAALAQLVRRIDTGRWDDVALTPMALNASATGLGPSVNVLMAPYSGPMDAAFTAFEPPPFARAFDARTPNPAN